MLQRPDRSARPVRSSYRQLLAAGAGLIVGHHPHVVQETAEPLLSRIRPPAPRIGFVCRRPVDDLVCQPTDVPQDPQTGPFWSGEIDLTGDGVAELVRREGEQIVIYSEGVDNLVVLEETAEGQRRTLSVWRWHGWGYTLLWRSPPSHYHDLVLLPGRGGRQAVISVAVRFGE